MYTPLSTEDRSLWRQIMRKNFIRWDHLADFLELNDSQRENIKKNPKFPLNLPFRLAQKIEKGTLDDPILRQFLPVKEEEKSNEDYQLDPVKDATFRKKPKLLHKYEGRVLLVCTSACAMNCRFCFRQNFDYSTEAKTLDPEIAFIAADATIKEVILSGGDPLSLSNAFLKELFEKLDQIAHVKRIRFHSRFPIGIPERIDEEFLRILKNCTKKIWFVLHCNHARELDADILERVFALQSLGIPVMSQSILLKGVNDSENVLQELCEKMVDHGIVPYYLHQLDRVQGSAHFEVPKEEGIKLMEKLTTKLSGYAVPKYVCEVSGEPSKTSLY